MQGRKLTARVAEEIRKGVAASTAGNEEVVASTPNGQGLPECKGETLRPFSHNATTILR